MDIPIFTIWLTDNDWDAMPFLYELCIASWQVFNPNKKIIIYTNHELHLSFLDRQITDVRQLNDFYPETYIKAAILSKNKAHQSDYIRYSILSQHEGIYLDTDVLLWSNIDNCLYEQIANKIPVAFPKEDENMICNCFISSSGENVEIFEDLLYNYEHNYIEHSYLFNSQKMLNLLTRRYLDSVITIKEPTLFECNWKGERINELKQEINYEITDCDLTPPGFHGVGTHLYSSIMNEWKAFKQWLDINCYNKNDNRYIIKLTNYIINEYIKLMKEVDTNVKK